VKVSITASREGQACVEGLRWLVPALIVQLRSLIVEGDFGGLSVAYQLQAYIAMLLRKQNL